MSDISKNEAIRLFGTRHMENYVKLNIEDALNVLKNHQAHLFDLPQCIRISPLFSHAGYHHFIEQENLPRYYEDVVPESATHAYANILAYHVLSSSQYSTYEDISKRLEVLSYLLENKKHYGLKDSEVVQYFVENNYAEDSALPDILRLVLIHCDLSSDTQGYIIQIICVNGFQSELFPAIEAGSDVRGFLARYENPTLWRHEQEVEKELIDDESYTIYKKFDTLLNHAETTLLERVNKVRETIEFHDGLQRKLSDGRSEKRGHKI